MPSRLCLTLYLLHMMPFFQHFHCPWPREGRHCSIQKLFVLPKKGWETLGKTLLYQFIRCGGKKMSLRKAFWRRMQTMQCHWMSTGSSPAEIHWSSHFLHFQFLSHTKNCLRETQIFKNKKTSQADLKHVQTTHHPAPYNPVNISLAPQNILHWIQETSGWPWI